MSTIRKPLDATAIALMVLICLVWSVQQIGLKATGHLAAPVLQIGIRSVIAALCVWTLVRFRGERIAFSGGVAVTGAFVGLLFAFEFLLVGESIKHTSASHVVVFLYTAPIFAALGLHWKLPSERLAAGQWAGIALAAIGIAIAFIGNGPSTSGDLSSMLLGDLMALVAGAGWGATTIVIRCSRLSAVPAAHTLFYQLATAGLILTVAAVVSGQTLVVPTWSLGLNLAFQSLVVCFFSFLVWFWMLTKYRASQLGVLSLMSPLFGVVLGVLLLGEPLSKEFVLGSSIVLAGIVIVTGYPWLQQWRLRHAQPVAAKRGAD